MMNETHDIYIDGSGCHTFYANQIVAGRKREKLRRMAEDALKEFGCSAFEHLEWFDVAIGDSVLTSTGVRVLH